MKNTILSILFLSICANAAYTTNQPSGRFSDSLRVDSLRNASGIKTDANGKFFKSDSIPKSDLSHKAHTTAAGTADTNLLAASATDSSFKKLTRAQLQAAVDSVRVATKAWSLKHGGTIGTLPKFGTDSTLVNSHVSENGDTTKVTYTNSPADTFAKTSLYYKDLTDGCSAPNGDCYFFAGTVYIQYGGSGSLSDLSQTGHTYRGATSTPDGSIWASSSDSIWKRTGGTGNFASVGGYRIPSYGITSDPSGNVYVIGMNEILYKCDYGTTDFYRVDSIYQCFDIHYAKNGDFYFIAYSPTRVCMIPNGSSSKIDVLSDVGCRSLGSDTAGNVYAISGSKVYKRTGGVGKFEIIQYLSTTAAGNFVFGKQNGDAYVVNNASLTTSKDTIMLKTNDPVNTVFKVSGGNSEFSGKVSIENTQLTTAATVKYLLAKNVEPDNEVKKIPVDSITSIAIPSDNRLLLSTPSGKIKASGIQVDTTTGDIKLTDTLSPYKTNVISAGGNASDVDNDPSIISYSGAPEAKSSRSGFLTFGGNEAFYRGTILSSSDSGWLHITSPVYGLTLGSTLQDVFINSWNGANRYQSPFHYFSWGGAVDTGRLVIYNESANPDDIRVTCVDNIGGLLHIGYGGGLGELFLEPYKITSTVQHYFLEGLFAENSKSLIDSVVSHTVESTYGNFKKLWLESDSIPAAGSDSGIGDYFLSISNDSLHRTRNDYLVVGNSDKIDGMHEYQIDSAFRAAIRDSLRSFSLIPGGTIGTLPKFGTDSTLVNSHFSESGDTSAAISIKTGIGVSIPKYMLDVEPASPLISVAKFGYNAPIYIMHSYPTLGFNCKYNRDRSRWEFGKTNAGGYGAIVEHYTNNGVFAIRTSSDSGTIDSAVNLVDRLTINKVGKVEIGSDSNKLVVENTKTTVNGRLVLKKANSVGSATSFAVFGSGSDSNVVNKLPSDSVSLSIDLSSKQDTLNRSVDTYGFTYNNPDYGLTATSYFLIGNGAWNMHFRGDDFCLRPSSTFDGRLVFDLDVAGSSYTTVWTQRNEAGTLKIGYTDTTDARDGSGVSNETNVVAISKDNVKIGTIDFPDSSRMYTDNQIHTNTNGFKIATNISTASNSSVTLKIVGRDAVYPADITCQFFIIKTPFNSMNKIAYGYGGPSKIYAYTSGGLLNFWFDRTLSFGSYAGYGITLMSEQPGVLYTVTDTLKPSFSASAPFPDSVTVYDFRTKKVDTLSRLTKMYHVASVQSSGLSSTGNIKDSGNTITLTGAIFKNSLPQYQNHSNGYLIKTDIKKTRRTSMYIKIWGKHGSNAVDCIASGYFDGTFLVNHKLSGAFTGIDTVFVTSRDSLEFWVGPQPSGTGNLAMLSFELTCDTTFKILNVKDSTYNHGSPSEYVFRIVN